MVGSDNGPGIVASADKWGEEMVNHVASCAPNAILIAITWDGMGNFGDEISQWEECLDSSGTP